ncbi:hypothetical protein QE436_000287 [Pantoea anthophila]|nr:hypothetical protein [Pantoea anthophila]
MTDTLDFALIFLVAMVVQINRPDFNQWMQRI